METYILVFALGILVGFLAYRAKVLRTNLGTIHITTDEEGKKFAYISFKKDPRGLKGESFCTMKIRAVQTQSQDKHVL